MTGTRVQAVTFEVPASPDILPAVKPCPLRFHSSSTAAPVREGEPVWDVSESTITERGDISGSTMVKKGAS